MDIKYNTDTKIEDNARLYQLQKANFDQEVNTAVSLFAKCARSILLTKVNLMIDDLYVILTVLRKPRPS